jgi:hydrogenase maturation protease
MRPGLVIFCCGNASRGDDAIGPVIFDRLQNHGGTFDAVCDYQLQIEHALDLADRECAIFVDAAIDIETAFEMKQIFPARDASYSTHALSPEALLEVCERVVAKQIPKAYLLGVKGVSFELSEPLSPCAWNNLEAAWVFLMDFLTSKCNLGKGAIPG